MYQKVKMLEMDNRHLYITRIVILENSRISKRFIEMKSTEHLLLTLPNIRE